MERKEMVPSESLERVRALIDAQLHRPLDLEAMARGYREITD
jgi:hypothetical protein